MNKIVKKESILFLLYGGLGFLNHSLIEAFFIKMQGCFVLFQTGADPALLKGGESFSKIMHNLVLNRMAHISQIIFPSRFV